MNLRPIALARKTRVGCDFTAGAGHERGVVVDRALPPLPPGERYPWFKRWLPDRLFYVLPTCMWIALGLRHGSLTLPSVANPAMEVGGLWGERKSQCLSVFGRKAGRHVAHNVGVTRSGDPSADTDMNNIAVALRGAGIDYPLVVKPDRGYQGWGVRAVANPAELRAYLVDVTEGAGLLLQTRVDWPGEAGIFYIREPGAVKGRIVSVALSYPPHVVGDGRSSVAALVQSDRVLRANATTYREGLGAARYGAVPAMGEVVTLTNTRSARLGAVYLDALPFVTPQLEAVIEEIAEDIEEFHFGRFDIRFRSMEALRRGEDFLIVELNGVGAEVLHIWAGGVSLRTAYRTLWWQYRTLFRIAVTMRRRGGYRPAGILTMYRLQREQERLRRDYPTSG